MRRKKKQEYTFVILYLEGNQLKIASKCVTASISAQMLELCLRYFRY